MQDAINERRRPLSAKRITDRGMQAKPQPTDQWLNQPFARGGGVFVARITPGGERLFYFRYSAPDGSRPFLPIGAYHPRGDRGLTVAQAYDQAASLSALYRAGHRDLRTHLRQQEDARQRAAALAEQAERERLDAAARRVTLRGLFDQWRAAELRPQLQADGTRIGRKDGGEWVLQSFERRVFPRIGTTPADEVTRASLLAILDDCKAEGKLRTATMLFTDLRQMLRFAVEREILQHNPLDGIKRAKVGGKAVERDRFLTDGELRTLLGALPHARLHRRTALAIKLILSTAVRVGEAMSARWEHVDREQATWYLPDTKNQRDHVVHLSDFALAQFEELKALREAGPDGKLSPWVFPNRAGDGPVCVKSFGKQLADRQRPPTRRMARRTKATRSLQLPGGTWTAHDLRRTAATQMAALGISGDVIDECLNHVIESRVRRTYIRNRRPEEQARAFDALGSRLEQLATSYPADSTVVPLRRSAASSNLQRK